IDELSELTIPDVSGFATTTALNNGLNGKANTSHTHAISNVEGLEDALDGKQAAGSYATTTALNDGLNGKANTEHAHAISNVEGLEDALAGKQAAGSYATTSQLAEKIDVSEIIEEEDQVGLLKAVFIENGGTPPSGLDPYTLVIELEE